MISTFNKKVLLPVWFAVLTMGIVASVASSGLAQNERMTDAERQQALLDDLVIQRAIAEKDDGYVRPTVQNLSKLYWVIGKMDIKSDQDIDNFLRINECTLYTRFYHNDFEWDQIREATRKHIQESLAEFPSTFEITNAITIGRYDANQEFFEVEKKNQIDALRRLDFTMNRSIDRQNCGKPGYIPGYPENFVVIMNRPLTVKKIPVKPELARMYIEESKRQFESLPLKYQIRAYERLAYLRLKIRVLQYKETTTSISGDPRAVVFGRLEGYEVYADPEMMKPLYFKVFDDRSTRRRVIKRVKKKIPEKEDVDNVVGTSVEKARTTEE